MSDSSGAAFKETVRELSVELDLEPGLACGVCGCCWCRLRMRRLADVDCPNCGAGYADVRHNIEP